MMDKGHAGHTGVEIRELVQQHISPPVGSVSLEVADRPREKPSLAVGRWAARTLRWTSNKIFTPTLSLWDLLSTYTAVERLF